MLERMEQAARDLGLDVRYENISRPGYTGGLCRVKDRWLVILNKGAPPDERIEALASALAARETDGVFLPPDVREAIDRARPPVVPDPDDSGSGGG
jgi:hypothetical protein